LKYSKANSHTTRDSFGVLYKF